MTTTRLQSFEPLPQLEPLVSLPKDTLKDMSTDSAVCFRLVRAAGCVVLGSELACRLVGSLAHFRWLTTYQSFLLLCMSANQDLDGEHKRTLRLIAKWVAQVYFHLSFKIKVQRHLVHGPHHLLTLLRLHRQQDPDAREAVAPYVRSEPWWAHSDIFLTSVLCSSNDTEKSLPSSRSGV